MKKISALIIAACSTGLAAHGQTLVNAFAGESLSDYTETPVLYSGTSPDTTTVTFSDASGLQAVGNTYNNIEQVLFLTSADSLSVGQALVVNVNYGTAAAEDIGIAVASTATPTAVSTTYSGSSTSTRNDLGYAFIGLRDGAGHVVSSGFDGATALTTQQYQPSGANTTELYIDEVAANTFNMGYISTGDGSVPTVLTTYTFANTTGVGDAIGVYVDMRGASTLGALTDLTIEPDSLVPEPTSMALFGMGLAGVGFYARRKAK